MEMHFTSFRGMPKLYATPYLRAVKMCRNMNTSFSEDCEISHHFSGRDIATYKSKRATLSAKDNDVRNASHTRT